MTGLQFIHMAPVSNTIVLNSKLIQPYQYIANNPVSILQCFQFVFSRAYVSKHAFEERHGENIVCKLLMSD